MGLWSQCSLNTQNTENTRISELNANHVLSLGTNYIALLRMFCVIIH